LTHISVIVQRLIKEELRRRSLKQEECR